MFAVPTLKTNPHLAYLKVLSKIYMVVKYIGYRWDIGLKSITKTLDNATTIF